MAQLRNLGMPFGSPGGIINIPAPGGSALAGQLQMQAWAGLGQALGAYFGRKRAEQVRQRDIQGMRQTEQRQGIFDTMYGARKMQAPEAQYPVMQSQMGQQAQLGGMLQGAFGDPFGVQRTKAQLQAAQAKTALGVLPKEKLTRATTLRKEFQAHPVYKSFQTIERSEKSMKVAYEKSVADKTTKSRIASDQALGVLFQKLLDPTSVVRESEYARTPEGAGIMSRIKSVLPRLARGGLGISDEDRKELYEMAEALLVVAKEQMNKHIKNYIGFAQGYDVDPKLVLGNIKRFDIQPEEDLEGKSDNQFIVDPFSLSQEGQIATNPKTGERMIKRKGKWFPYESK